MNKIKRYSFQVALLFIIWLLLWSGQNWEIHFLFENLPAFIAQIVLIGFLIYYMSPKYLFTKQYGLFVGISIISILGISFLASVFTPQTIIDLPRPRHLNPIPPPKPPSQFLTQFLLIVLAYVLALVVEVVFYNQKNEEALIKSQAENLDTELKLLKSQINPHFLFNALNNIYALSGIDTTKTQQSISYLSDMLRYVLYECEQPLVTLQKEMDYIDNYIKLFKLKSSKTYPITTNLKVTNPNIKLAPMLLIPFIENAFKHSNIEKVTGTFINIDIETVGNTIHFEVKNSIPETPKTKDELGGIGLENVKKRLAILYPDAHDLQIKTNNNTFTVFLKLEQHV